MKKTIMKSAIGGLAAAGLMFSAAVSYADDTLRIVSWGGAYQKGQSLGIFQPAAKAMGITVKEDTYGGISDVKLMVKSGADKFDIFSSGAGSCASGAAEGVLEKLDYSVIDVSNHLPGMYSDYCAGADIFSVVAAYNTETYGEEMDLKHGLISMTLKRDRKSTRLNSSHSSVSRMPSSA